MILPWAQIRRRIVQGTVFLDRKYQFNDDSITPKYIVVLTPKELGGRHVICPTTSQVQTYAGSYSCYIRCSDPAFPKPTIVEIERCHFAMVSRMQLKYENADLVYIGVLSPKTLQELLEALEESDRIEAPFKDAVLGL